MSHRNELLSKLNSYRTTILDPDQIALTKEIEEFIKSEANCFDRELLIGHVTGSAVLLNQDLSKICLTLHRKFNKWVQLGGHADGNPDIFSVALREAQEESGITNITALTTDIFDVCIHNVPEFNNIPAHKHYDIRFLFHAQSNAPLVINHESIELAWFERYDPLFTSCDPSVQRLIHKWQSMTLSKTTEVPI